MHQEWISHIIPLLKPFVRIQVKIQENVDNSSYLLKSKRRVSSPHSAWGRGKLLILDSSTNQVRARVKTTEATCPTPFTCPLSPVPPSACPLPHLTIEHSSSFDWLNLPQEQSKWKLYPLLGQLAASQLHLQDANAWLGRCYTYMCTVTWGRFSQSELELCCWQLVGAGGGEGRRDRSYGTRGLGTRGLR